MSRQRTLFRNAVVLTIDPARLSSTDFEQFRKWFATDGAHTLTITNLDGQTRILARLQRRAPASRRWNRRRGWARRRRLQASGSAPHTVLEIAMAIQVSTSAIISGAGASA